MGSLIALSKMFSSGVWPTPPSVNWLISCSVPLYFILGAEGCHLAYDLSFYGENHAVFSAGIVATETGYLNVSELRGVGRILLTLGSFGLISLGMIGCSLSAVFGASTFSCRKSRHDAWILLAVLLSAGCSTPFTSTSTITAFGESTYSPGKDSSFGLCWCQLWP